ncbi:MAG: hypothetical protein B7Z08_09030 [Sphingomonadales bacterium 32-68-7]|nr:MAG: hypothetical protein B7Z33_05985 [Sphingomonadales bacterium 12-68-11]OYX08552.1 MAG: hypothetical protein B7Z08_09030 [Sphingomonadales bacterium 32-68-7]
MRQILVWLALLAALIGAPAAAQLQFPPRPEGPVYDAADILPPAEEAALDARLREYNARTGRSLIVATVPTLQEDTIENYAVRLFEAWGIGGAETDQGLLLLVAPNERKVRIEVGYGLHQYVTDILSGRIVRNEITPRFREGNYAAGITAGVGALITQLDRDPAEARAIAEAAAAAERQRGQGDNEVAFAALIVPLFFLAIFLFTVGRRGRRYGGRSTAGAVGEVLLWTAINAAMNSRGGDGGGWGGGGGGGGGGFGGFGGGMSGGGGASGSW